MKISQNGIDIIKKYEGCYLKAYLCPAGKWTIGYGHTSGVTQGMTITMDQAEEYLRADCETAEKAVNNLNRDFTQNQFDALVSFTYNCGGQNLRTLCGNRTLEVIADKMLLYVKSGGIILKGLEKRRKEEQKLFLLPTESAATASEERPVLRMGSRGAQVRRIQEFLTEKGMYHGAIDGIFGSMTKQAVIEWQGYCEITKDGVVGKYTWATMS